MYSPKISEEHIPSLYRLAKDRKVHMTRLVNQIIKNYLLKNRVRVESNHAIRQ